MFDLTSSKLLILAVVALLVVGPKDFPLLLRTVGKYMGLIKRQAAEFRAQFDEAMREAELDQMKAEVEKMSREIEESVRDADRAVQTEMGAVHREVGGAVDTIGSDEMSSGAMGPQRKALPAGAATEVAADTSSAALPRPGASHYEPSHHEPSSHEPSHHDESTSRSESPSHLNGTPEIAVGREADPANADDAASKAASPEPQPMKTHS